MSKIKQQLKMVERFLQEWDPIEVTEMQVRGGVPPTEYDTYAPGVLGLLSKGCSSAELTEHLLSLRRDKMGLGQDTEADEQIARGLVRWWQDRATR